MGVVSENQMNVCPPPPPLSLTLPSHPEKMLYETLCVDDVYHSYFDPHVLMCLLGVHSVFGPVPNFTKQNRLVYRSLSVLP